MRSSMTAPTFEEVSLSEACREYRYHTQNADDPMSALRAQRALDRVILRCQRDATLPDPVLFFLNPSSREKMLGPMHWEMRYFDSFVDLVESELEGRQRSVVGI